MVSDEELAREIEKVENQRQEVDELEARVGQLEESAKHAHSVLADRIDGNPDAESIEELAAQLHRIEPRLDSLEDRLE